MADVLKQGLIEIILAVLGVLGLAIKFLPPYVHKWRNQRMRASVIQGLMATRDAYLALREITKETSAERAIIFAGHNSGGVPRPHSPFYVTALHWDVTKKDKNDNIRDYQNLAVDPWYIGMLLDIERDGYIILNPDAMPECQLKQFYQLEGVSESVVFFIDIRENKFMYMSVAKYKGNFTTEEITKIGLKVAKIKKYMSEYI